MIPHPTALGLTVCDAVIVEEGTRNVFARQHVSRRSESVPDPSRPAAVFASTRC